MVWPGGNLSLIFHPCSQTAENRESTWQTIFTACLGLIHNALARTDRQTHSSAAFLITPRPASIRHREPPTPPVDVSRKTGRVPPSFKPNSSVNWRATRLFYFISSPPSYFRFSIFTFAPFGREGREGKRFGEQKEYISTALGKGGHAVNLFKLRAMFQRVQQLLLSGPGQSKSSKTSKSVCAWDRLGLYTRPEEGRVGEGGTMGRPRGTQRHREISLPLFLLSFVPPLCPVYFSL